MDKQVQDAGKQSIFCWESSFWHQATVSSLCLEDREDQSLKCWQTNLQQHSVIIQTWKKV